MPEKKDQPAPKKAAAPKPEKTEKTVKKAEPKQYVSKDHHLLVYVIRTPKHEWRARRMLTDGRYVWRIPADEVKAFEAHEAFKNGRVVPYDG